MKSVKNGLIIAGCAALSAVSSSALAGPFYLGEAGNFNAYIMEDFTGQQSDVEGRLAVGGNLNTVDYGFGYRLPASNQSNVVVVGYNATIRNARIYNGDAVAGGDIDIDDTVGLYNGEDTANSRGFYQDNSFDFASANNELMYQSALWGAYNATADTVLSGNSDGIYRIDFNGTDDLNVFSIDAAALSSPNKGIYIDVPETSYSIINVFGDAANLFNTGFHLPFEVNGSDKFPDNDSSGADADRHPGYYADNVLFNFVDATSLVLEGIGFKGSILAPLADLTFSNGHIDGQLFAKSLTSDGINNTGQINNYRFGGFTEISEPATIAAFGLVVTGLIGMSRRRLQRQAA